MTRSEYDASNGLQAPSPTWAKASTLPRRIQARKGWFRRFFGL